MRTPEEVETGIGLRREELVHSSDVLPGDGLRFLRGIAKPASRTSAAICRAREIRAAGPIRTPSRRNRN